MSIRLYNVIYSIQRFFDDNLGIKADWIYDGYEYPSERPFITIESLTDERTILSKGRESVQIIEHLQLSYYAKNIVDRTNRAEEIADLLTFNKVPYYTEESAQQPAGYFLCEVTAVVPIPADDITRHSEYHRVHFDVEIENIKRRW